jgi:8-oxo-dGTP diphosphatase
VVVGAALFSDGKVLAARRTAPPALAGRWEFPGGKVEPDESEPEALIRELREELSLDVRVIELLGRARLGDGRELALYLSRPTGGCAEPDVDHDCVRWLSPAELSSVSWLDADRLLLSVVGEALHREVASGLS